MSKDLIVEELEVLVPKGIVKMNEPLHHYTFTKTGGVCDYFVQPNAYSELQQVVKFAIEENIPYTIIGNGSNMIIRDGGIRGMVINFNNLKAITCKNEHIIAQSGATIIDVSKYALENSLTGLEFACGIPGSVGGAVFMNAGAYGGEISDVLESVLVLTQEGDFLTLSKDDLQMSYRQTIISKINYIILEATFTLSLGDQTKIKEKMDELTYLRESKQPLEYPSCGSVFKRPPGYFAGKLIQDSGLQGYQIGGVQVSTKHAGFMVNVDNGTASDYIALIKHVQKTVYEKYGVQLETEVKIIGEE